MSSIRAFVSVCTNIVSTDKTVYLSLFCQIYDIAFSQQPHRFCVCSIVLYNFRLLATHLLHVTMELPCL
jgi:hypothetical protein